MKIEVTQQDIDKGICRGPYLCPVARAVKRATRRQKVGVWADEEAPLDKAFKVEIPKDNFYFKVPTKVNNFVQNFDSGNIVKPFTFVLRGYKRSK